MHVRRSRRLIFQTSGWDIQPRSLFIIVPAHEIAVVILISP
jgi:hypothetical protein